MGKPGANRNGEYYATAGCSIERMLRAISGSREPADCCHSLNFKEAEMKYSTLARIRVLFAMKLIGRMRGTLMFLFLLGMVMGAPPLCAQQFAAPSGLNELTPQLLLQRIDQLDGEIKELRAALVKITAEPPNQAPSQAAPPRQPDAESQAQPPEPQGMDVNRTLLRIRGFSDITFHGSDHIHDSPLCQAYTCFPSSFTLGQVNLFVTSDLSERFKFLSEIVFESDEFNNFGVDVERVLLQYSQNDYLNVAVGRYHTAIGYYNTAYHHSTWFQTTTGRPFLFDFEDKGGPLPIHNVGISLSGRIPSGAMGLHYVVEVGNGRASRSYVPPQGQTATAVQSYVDENAHKAVNVALFARPDSIPGLQVGFSAYRDVLTPGVPARIGETILAAHAVFIRTNFEWLNEALVIRHTPQGGRLYDTPGGYTQISKRFGSYRPYFRYQYLNAADSEPLFPDIRLRAGPSVGIRYDPTDFVALKFQYDYTQLRANPGINGLALQAGFTF
jgi:hypothetical protein